MMDWQFSETNLVIAPGQINGKLDVRHAGSACVLQIGEQYGIFYWGIGEDGVYRICQAETRVDSPNDWQPLGNVLGPQEDSNYNCRGPSFPFVVCKDERQWFMYVGCWGMAREDGKLPNTTGLAISNDGGESWEYVSDEPILPLDKTYDCEGTGSVCVLYEGGKFRMYYTAIGSYFDKPHGVQTGHGDVIPRIGVGYAESTDGIHWVKPLDDLMVAPRGFDTDPYEYISSKPWVIHDGSVYRMWVSTFGTAYRIRSLVSDDGLDWTWQPSGVDGDFGVGNADAFDDHQRCYASVVRYGDEYRCWYTGNGFGRTGMGYATGVRER